MKFIFIDGLFTYNLPCFCGQCQYTYNSWIYIWIGISDRRCERCVHSGTMEEISNMMSMIAWINVNIPFTSPWAKLKVWKQKPHRNPGVKITLNGSPDSTRTTRSAHEKYSPFPNSRCLGLCCSDTKVAGTQNHCISTSDGEPLPVSTEKGNFP